MGAGPSKQQDGPGQMTPGGEGSKEGVRASEEQHDTVNKMSDFVHDPDLVKHLIQLADNEDDPLILFHWDIDGLSQFWQKAAAYGAAAAAGGGVHVPPAAINGGNHLAGPVTAAGLNQLKVWILDYVRNLANPPPAIQGNDVALPCNLLQNNSVISALATMQQAAWFAGVLAQGLEHHNWTGLPGKAKVAHWPAGSMHSCRRKPFLVTKRVMDLAWFIVESVRRGDQLGELCHAFRVAMAGLSREEEKKRAATPYGIKEDKVNVSHFIGFFRSRTSSERFQLGGAGGAMNSRNLRWMDMKNLLSPGIFAGWY